MLAKLALCPRFLRAGKAPAYLGMDRHTFGEQVRPYLTTIPIGTRGIAFDRLELERFADYYKSAVGRSPERSASWQKETPPDSLDGETSGGLGSRSKVMDDYKKARVQVTRRKQNVI